MLSSVYITYLHSLISLVILPLAFDLIVCFQAREEMISRMEEQLKQEGVDVNGVTNVMEEMSKRNRELFKLPPYVLYVSRAFSTLEGIGLSINEDYSILQVA